MNWFTKFLTSSIGQKLVMSLTGLFLIVFLLVHLIGNLQLLLSDGGEAFNLYAEFMTTNPLIKLSSYGLYTFILLHAVQGWLLWSKNRKARGGQGYAVQATRAKGTNGNIAKRMGWLGTIVFIFLMLHLYQFWFQMHWGGIETATYGGVEVKDLYSIVKGTYMNPIYVVVYVLSMVVIGAHLLHGFQSSFQSLGLNHQKYTPFIKFLGTAYSILIPLGFAIIPIYMFVRSM